MRLHRYASARRRDPRLRHVLRVQRLYETRCSYGCPHGTAGAIPADPVGKAFELPYTISAGAAWKHGEQLTVGADYTMERWSGCRVPVLHSTVGSTEILVVTNQYINKHHISGGAEYMHNSVGRKYYERIRYRLGASYSTPYVKVNGANGPKEFSLNAGVALPLTTNTRSLINVSVQWLRRTPSVSNQITENYFVVHLGVTFNERWFEKWRFQ